MRTATVFALGFATALMMGAAASKPAASQPTVKKFPWASDALNQPCGKTELEWKCAAGKIDTRTVDFPRFFTLTHLEAIPAPAGLLIKANVNYRPGIPDEAKKKDYIWSLHDACGHIRKQVEARFCKVNDDFVGVEIELYLGEKLIARRNAKGFNLENGK